IDERIIKEITDTLLSGWLTTGKKTKLFEEKIKNYTGCQSVLCVSSATEGLELVLRWFGVGSGDEVILPAYTYAATANVIIHCGATPVFVDVNRDDFNISIESIKNAITDKTKVIIPVDMGGLPCDYKEILNLTFEKKGIFRSENEVQKKFKRILVLSDAAHSFGAKYSGMQTGVLGDITVFSFQVFKNITTAEGGAICFDVPNFDNNELYKHFSVFSLQGQTKNAFQKSNTGNWRYDIVDAGYKCNMNDVCASIGLAAFDYYEGETLAKRKRIFDIYKENLSGLEWAEVPIYETKNKKSSYHIFLFRIKNITEKQRDLIINELFNRGVLTNVHFVPVPMFTYYKNHLGYDIKNYPVSYDNYSREITLPVYCDLQDEQINEIISELKWAYQKWGQKY
ncbi:MAG: DegT/DnrJ/EryC1/StrS family aminotransferase, partial [Bacteroidota bacterium]